MNERTATLKVGAAAGNVVFSNSIRRKMPMMEKRC